MRDRRVVPPAPKFVPGICSSLPRTLMGCRPQAAPPWVLHPWPPALSCHGCRSSGPADLWWQSPRVSPGGDVPLALLLGPRPQLLGLLRLHRLPVFGQVVI